MKKNKIKAGALPCAENMPRHIGIIMDGNGRWAKKRLFPRSVGHRYGMDRMMGLLRHALDAGVNYVTVYALSTENFSRPQKELEGLFDLIRNHFVPCMREIAERKARVRVIGDLSLFPEDVRELLVKAQEDSATYEGKGVNVALGYGSRAEIARAASLAAEKARQENREVTEKDVSDHLYTAGIPDPDLIIRTGKEVRLSNFLLWQSAYAELYFSDKMFPDFSDRDLDEAIVAYANRTRRFGKTDEQCETGETGEIRNAEKQAENEILTQEKGE